MSDEFGTVNVGKGERKRELDAVRQQYAAHRDALVRMTADAPTEQLSAEYQRLIRKIDENLAKLDEIEGRPASEAGNRPLITTAPDQAETVVEDMTPPEGESSGQGARVMMIVVAGVIVLAAIIWLLWRASGDHNPRTAEQPVQVTTPAVETAAPVATQPDTPVAAAVIKITPLAADYGTIRKGTRAVRQFSVENSTNAAVPLKIARSTCKCLYYEYAEKVPAHGKESISVTIDGARAKAGGLHETVQVSSKNDASVTASFQVNATIQ